MKLRIAYIGDSHGYLKGDPITRLGGAARAATAFAKLTAKYPELLKFHGGDILGASPFSTYFKGRADLEAFSQFNFLAYVPGNHDFHLGTQNLSEMIKAAAKPFVAANLDCTEDPFLKGDLIKPFLLLPTSFGKLAIIGVTTPEINKLGEQKTGKVKILDLKTSIDTAISQAQQQGAKQFVILSHLGYEADKDFVKSCLAGKNISFIILGNHSHTTCGKNLPPVLFGESKGEYPTVIDLGDKHLALITTVPHNLQVVSWLEVEYDVGNHLSSYSSNTTLVLNEEYEEDLTVQGIVTNYEKKLPSTLSKVFAQATIAYSGLEGQPPFAKCIEDFIRQTESPIGNLAADAFYWQAKQLDGRVDLALIHAGGIRTDWTKGPITGLHLHELHPFDKHNIVVLELTGSELCKALEESVSNDNFHRRGEFLIGSKNFCYHYNITNPPDSRISQVKIDTKDIDLKKVYRVAINGFMANANNCFGKPGIFKLKMDYLKLNGLHENYAEFHTLDREAVMNYFENNPQARLLTGKLDGRIIFQGISLLDQYASRGVSVEEKYISCMNNLEYQALTQSAKTEKSSPSPNLKLEM